jgi:hypothetical protein
MLSQSVDSKQPQEAQARALFIAVSGSRVRAVSMTVRKDLRIGEELCAAFNTLFLLG